MPKQSSSPSSSLDFKPLFKPKWTEYIKTQPTPKQLVFTSLPATVKEALFGGSAGGGKSEALLQGALQYVDTPGYSAIIFRRRLTDLEMPGALIFRSHQWLTGTDAKWNGNRRTWTFPSGAILAFGYLDNDSDMFRYQSDEFQYIAFDELGEFPYNTEFDDVDADGNTRMIPANQEYLFLFSRLRRAKGINVPLRFRAGTNPGGKGHRWIKERFRIVKHTDPETGKISFKGEHPKRLFIPSALKDNPYLMEEEYVDSLSNLDPVTRAQLLNGDWSATVQTRFREAWIRYYTVTRTTDYINLEGGKSFQVSRCWCFQTVDPAASSRAGPGDRDIFTKKEPSATVISTWLVTPDNDLVWWDMVRMKEEIPDILVALKTAHQNHRPDYIGIEANGLGIGVFQMAMRSGLPVKDLKPRGTDKLVRSTDAANRMEKGKIYFPRDGVGGGQTPWLKQAKDEVFSWIGHPHEAADIVDTLSYAAMEISERAAYSEMPMGYNDLPSHYNY